ncbi:hypothetical protein Cgig2_007027 [Carnegiea gigantea]|uniref:EamA domain-containing protein n=1 Tax=Carnegiea gigantea TaxID=171969 RepID=A0A9Q1KAS1_9CARY|nr:hypothetical protein Cgig2_007027 [Carnegiea gigantea]
MESEAAPFVGMLMAECAQVGLIIISKQALATGMPNFVFVFYSNALASFILLCLCLLIYRSGRPPLSFSMLCWFFLLGLVGCLSQLFGYAGINYSSPTLATAMLNLVPGLTFLLAVVLRMEKLDWRSLTCLAKLVGTIVSIGGAFVATLYQGPPLLALSMPVPVDTHQLNLLGERSKWVLGGFFLAVDCVLTSSWVIIQVHVKPFYLMSKVSKTIRRLIPIVYVQAVILKKYPAELIVVCFYCFFVAIQSGIVSLIVERDPSVWRLEPKLRLFSILYSAPFGSVLQVGLASWCLRRKGPVFVCMFKPLGIAIAVIAGVLFFGDTLYLGSLLGVTVIVLGFYSVMWGKAKEEQMSRASQLSGVQSTTEKRVEELQDADICDQHKHCWCMETAMVLYAAYLTEIPIASPEKHQSSILPATLVRKHSVSSEMRSVIRSYIIDQNVRSKSLI